MPANAQLSILIPVRTEQPDFVLKRLKLRDGCDFGGVEVVLTDDGSGEAAARHLHEFCQAREWTYQRLETGAAPFSLARARNAGLDQADTRWVFFDDADMAYGSRFFQSLQAELKLLDQTPFNFVSFPAAYLSSSVSEEVMAQGTIDPSLPRLLTHAMLEDPRGGENNRVIDSFSPASAILAMAKSTALAAGGYDERFEGWGGEDRDFIFRLLAANKALPRPAEFEATRMTNLNDTHNFAGWRSLFRLHGDYMARKGFYAFHLYHDAKTWRSKEGQTRNFQMAASNALSFQDRDREQFVEGQSHLALRRSLIFSTYADSFEGIPAQSRKSSGNVSARYRKLLRDPHAFFRDARSPILRALRHCFPERHNQL